MIDIILGIVVVDNETITAVCERTRIITFLESISFKDAIHNAISLGGDSDMIGAIPGSIAEAY